MASLCSSPGTGNRAIARSLSCTPVRFGDIGVIGYISSLEKIKISLRRKLDVAKGTKSHHCPFFMNSSIWARSAEKDYSV